MMPKRRARLADVAGRADGDVEPVIRAHGEVTPAVAGAVGHVGVDDGGIAGIGKAVLDAGPFDDPSLFGDVEVAAAEGDAIGDIEAPREDVALVRPAVAVGVAQGIEAAAIPGADEHGAVLAQGHGSRPGHVGRENADMETGRQLNLAQWQIRG